MFIVDLGALETYTLDILIVYFTSECGFFLFFKKFLDRRYVQNKAYKQRSNSVRLVNTV